MKNTNLITGAVIIGGLFLIASTTFASYGQGSFSGMGIGMGQGLVRSNSGFINTNYSTYGVNMKREVKNIDNGIEITMTTTDTATIEHMKAMFTQNNINHPLNTSFKVERTQLDNGTKLTVTSTDSNTVKLIQERAATSQSGLFGNGGHGRGGMMGGRGFGRWGGAITQ